MATGGLKHFTGEVIEEKFLSCSICLEKFKNPKLLPCLHTFCLKCLDDYIKSATQQGSFPCPSCRQPTQVTNNLAADFKNNFFMNSLLDFFGETSSSHDCSFCSSAGKAETAITKCIDCSDYLCESCTKGHGMTRLTVKHKLVPIDQLQESEIHKGVADKAGFPCNDHPEENVRYYCTVCEKPVCRDCKALDHHDHKCVTFEEAAKERKPKMTDSLKFLQDELQEAVNWRGSVEEHSMKILKTSDVCKQAIEDVCNSMVQSLLTLKEETIAQINAKTSEYEKQIKAEREAAEMRCTQVKSFREYLSNVLNVGADVEILDTLSMAKKQNLIPNNVFREVPIQMGPMLRAYSLHDTVGRAGYRLEQKKCKQEEKKCKLFSEFASIVKNIINAYSQKCSVITTVTRNLLNKVGLQ